MDEWREHPIFVPFGGGHIAAIVSTPSSRPRGLAVLLTGWGATRSHRSRIWTRTARSLAERGIASVRFDYPGIGDSTGRASASLDDPPVEETLAVLDAARSITGDIDVALVGNCIGARTAFAVAARVPECRTVVGILLRKPGGIVVGGKESSPAAKGGARSAPTGVRRAANGALRARPRLKRVVKWVLSPVLYRPLRFIPDVEAVLRSRACLLLFLGDRVPAARLSRDVATLTKDAKAARTLVQHVQTPSIVGFRIPIRFQSQLIDEIIEWLSAHLNDPDRPSVEPMATTAESGRSIDG